MPALMLKDLGTYRSSMSRIIIVFTRVRGIDGRNGLPTPPGPSGIAGRAEWSRFDESNSSEANYDLVALSDYERYMRRYRSPWRPTILCLGSRQIVMQRCAIIGALGLVATDRMICNVHW